MTGIQLQFDLSVNWFLKEKRHALQRGVFTKSIAERV
jgi:hypothetical protein